MLNAADQYQQFSQLQQALNANNFEMAEKLVKAGISVNVTDDNERTLVEHYVGISKRWLSTAQRQDYLTRAAWLLSHGVLVNKVNNDGWALLHMACAANKTDHIKLLLKAGASVNLPNSDGDTPLHLLCQHFGSGTDTISLLLENGASVDAMNEEWEKPLDNAIRYGREDIAQLLLRDKASIGSSTLGLALERNASNIIEQLFKHKIDINEQDKWGNTALHKMSRDGKIAEAQMLINRGADVNKENFKTKDTPFHYAVNKGNRDMVKLLTEAGAQVNKKNRSGETPLWSALEKKSQYDYGYYLQKESDRRNYIDVMTYLLKKGASHYEGYYGQSLLDRALNRDWNGYYTVYRKDKEAIALLYAHGASTTDVNNYGPQFLRNIVGAERGSNFDKEQLLLLSQHGADLGPLLLDATEKDNREMLELLLKLKVQPDRVRLSNQSEGTIEDISACRALIQTLEKNPTKDNMSKMYSLLVILAASNKKEVQDEALEKLSTIKNADATLQEPLEKYKRAYLLSKLKMTVNETINANWDDRYLYYNAASSAVSWNDLTEVERTQYENDMLQLAYMYMHGVGGVKNLAAAGRIYEIIQEISFDVDRIFYASMQQFRIRRHAFGFMGCMKMLQEKKPDRIYAFPFGYALLSMVSLFTK